MEIWDADEEATSRGRIINWNWLCSEISQIVILSILLSGLRKAAVQSDKRHC